MQLNISMLDRLLGNTVSYKWDVIGFVPTKKITIKPNIYPIDMASSESIQVRGLA